MIHALPRLSRILFASALVLVPPAAPALAAGAPQQTAVPEPICIPWIICHIKLPGRLTVNDGGQGQKDIELLSWSWGASGAARPPMRASSDPEEGGEIAAKTVQKPARPSVSELTVSKKTDVASPTLLRSADGGAAEPGKVEYPNVQVSAGPSEPPPSGTLTIVVTRGSCASGKHLPEVKLSSRGRTYTLHDVDVTACADSGQNTDTCTLSYGSVAG